jgi:hypothetical protein
MFDVAVKLSQAAISIRPVKLTPQFGALAAVTAKVEPAAALLYVIAEVAVKSVQAFISIMPTSLILQSSVPFSDKKGPLATRLSDVFLVASVVMMLVEAFKVSHPLNVNGGGAGGIGGISSTSVKLNVHEGIKGIRVGFPGV